MRIEVEFSSLS